MNASATKAATRQLRCKTQVNATKKATITNGCGVCNSHKMALINPSITPPRKSNKGLRLAFIQSKAHFEYLPSSSL